MSEPVTTGARGAGKISKQIEEAWETLRKWNERPDQDKEIWVLGRPGYCEKAAHELRAMYERGDLVLIPVEDVMTHDELCELRDQIVLANRKARERQEGRLLKKKLPK